MLFPILCGVLSFFVFMLLILKAEARADAADDRLQLEGEVTFAKKMQDRAEAKQKRAEAKLEAMTRQAAYWRTEAIEHGCPDSAATNYATCD